jgi:hypothetical protein
LLRYSETNWKYEKGLETCKYDLAIDTINASKTRKEQQTKIEKISLVVFLTKEQKNFLVNICRRLRRNDKHFYQNKNLHVTLFGFGPLEKSAYERILKRLEQFSRKKKDNNMIISFNEVRPGSKYLDNKTMIPAYGMGNGTVVAVGDVVNNEKFCRYSNQLASYLLRDKKIESVLGPNFRRKFPTIWCTLGYYNKQSEYKISNDLNTIFRDYQELNVTSHEFHILEMSLVKSKYKNLRYPKLLGNFRF